MVYTPNTVASQVSKYMGNAVTVSDMWGGIVINVKAAPYLAKGDGVTDDTVAIQAAIDYAISIGKEEITFPAGTYIYTTLTNASGITCIGDGVTLSGTTDLKLTSLALVESKTRIDVTSAPYNADPTGLTDSTAAIQAALDFETDFKKTIVFPDGDYLINPVTKVKLKSNTRLEFSKDARLITALPSSDIYSMLDVVSVENVEIINPTIVGSRTTSAPVSGGAGHGISCRGVVNLKIIGATISDCYTDGIYINGVTNGLVEFTSSDNNRRQGMSITNVNNFVCRHSSFTNSNGTDPQMGIDIEPNNATDQLKGLLLENIYTANNFKSGIGINYNNLNSATTIIDITINKWRDEGSDVAFSCTKYSDSISEGSTIKVIDLTAANNKSCGINIVGHKADGTAKISLIRPVVYNPNVSNGTNERSQNVAISVNSETTGYPAGTLQGNVEIIEPYISMATGRTVLRGIYLGYDQGMKDILVQNPRKIDIGDAANLSNNSTHNFIGLNGAATNVKIVDIYKVLTVSSNTNAFRNLSTAVYSEYISTLNGNVSMFDFARFNTIDDFSVIKSQAGGTFTLTLPSTITFIDNTGSVITGTLSTTTTGAILTFKRLNNSFYKVVKEYGTWV